MMNGDDMLTVAGLNVAYGESKVLFDVGMKVRPCEVVACVGRNGAGKTTLLKTIAGFLKPTAGTITFNTTSLVGMAAFRVAGIGIKYVPQDKKVFSDLTVRENLELGSYATDDYDWSEVTRLLSQAQETDGSQGGISQRRRAPDADDRPIDPRQPQAALVDEPTEGLAPSIVAQLKEVFSELKKKTALVLVEQNLPLVCAIADKVYALKRGTDDGRIDRSGIDQARSL